MVKNVIDQKLSKQILKVCYGKKQYYKLYVILFSQPNSYVKKLLIEHLLTFLSYKTNNNLIIREPCRYQRLQLNIYYQSYTYIWKKLSQYNYEASNLI